jgi:hypothetical protein
MKRMKYADLPPVASCLPPRISRLASFVLLAFVSTLGQAQGAITGVGNLGLGFNSYSRIIFQDLSSSLGGNSGANYFVGSVNPPIDGVPWDGSLRTMSVVDPVTGDSFVGGIYAEYGGNDYAIRFTPGSLVHNDNADGACQVTFQFGILFLLDGAGLAATTVDFSLPLAGNVTKAGGFVNATSSIYIGQYSLQGNLLSGSFEHSSASFTTGSFGPNYTGSFETALSDTTQLPAFDFAPGQDSVLYMTGELTLSVGSSVQIVPEPSSLALLGLYGGLLAARRRRTSSPDASWVSPIWS